MLKIAQMNFFEEGHLPLVEPMYIRPWIYQHKDMTISTRFHIDIVQAMYLYCHIMYSMMYRYKAIFYEIYEYLQKIYQILTLKYMHVGSRWSPYKIIFDLIYAVQKNNLNRDSYMYLKF